MSLEKIIAVIILIIIVLVVSVLLAFGEMLKAYDRWYKEYYEIEE